MATIGIDIVEVERFRLLKRSTLDQFLKNTFTPEEREYCLSYKDAAPHLAGVFAAKEAVQKAMTKKMPHVGEIEVCHEGSGAPYVKIRGKKVTKMQVSIAHTLSTAVAVAFFAGV